MIRFCVCFEGITTVFANRLDVRISSQGGLLDFGLSSWRDGVAMSGVGRLGGEWVENHPGFGLKFEMSLS